MPSSTPSATWSVAVATVAFAAVRVAAAQTDDTIASVVVWAEKRAAVIDDVPISMSTFSGEQLDEAGIVDASGLAEMSATLDLQRNAGPTTSSLRIRRVGNIGNIPTFEPAVGMFVDGAFRSRSFLGTEALFAVDHIEILNGPQTALYGKNVSAGLVSVHTREPPADFEARAELTYGRIDSARDADLERAAFEIGGPLTPLVSASIAARFAQHSPTLRNVLPGGPDGNDEHRYSIKAQLAGALDDAFEWRLLAGYSREDDNQGESDVYLAPGAASAQVAGLLQQLELIPVCPDQVPRNRRLCSVATNTVDVEAADVTLLADYRFAGGWRLRSMTSWDRYTLLRTEDDAIQLFAPILFYRDAERGSSLQEEIRLLSADDQPLTWQVGSFYYRNDYDRGHGSREPMFGVNGELALDPLWSQLLGLPLALPGQLGLHDSSLDTRYISVFGQASWHLTPHWRLTGSVRWQEEKKTAVIDNAVTVPGVSLISAILTPQQTLAGEPVNGSLSRSSETVPWSVTAQYRFNDDAMAYLTRARGTKSGGFNTGFGDAPLAQREFGDETIQHYELGTRLALDAGRWAINAAAFFTRYDDYQDSAFISAQFSVGNAQRVELKGAELETRLRLNDRWLAGLSVSRADLRYAVNTDGLCDPGRTPDGSRPDTCVLSGRRPIQAPLWETSATLQYHRPTRWGSGFARCDWSWTDGYNTSFSADPRLTQPAYHWISLRAGVQIGRGSVTVWSENLLDETVSHFDSLLNLFNDTSYQSYLSAPRSYGVTARWQF